MFWATNKGNSDVEELARVGGGDANMMAAGREVNWWLKRGRGSIGYEAVKKC